MLSRTPFLIRSISPASPGFAGLSPSFASWGAAALSSSRSVIMSPLTTATTRASGTACAAPYSWPASRAAANKTLKEFLLIISSKSPEKTGSAMLSSSALSCSGRRKTLNQCVIRYRLFTSDATNDEKGSGRDITHPAPPSAHFRHHSHVLAREGDGGPDEVHCGAADAEIF